MASNKTQTGDETMTIRIADTKEMVTIVAELTMKGIGYEVTQNSMGDWVIQMTGSY